MAAQEEKVDKVKEMPPFLKRPFAIMRLFHEAARCGFKDLSKTLSVCEKELTEKNAQSLLDQFMEFEVLITIHKGHEDDGLYPALLKSVKERLEKEDYRPSKEKLEEGLKEIPSFSEEHKVDHEKLHKLEEELKSFVEAVKNDKDKDKAFKSTSTELNAWIDFHEKHLKHEESIMAPLMKNIAANKPEKVKIARTLLDVNKDLVLKYQFEYVLQQLLTMKEWYCPMTKHTYKGTEILIAYVNCFRMMSKDKEEYKLFADKASKVINEQQWKEMCSYGLASK